MRAICATPTLLQPEVAHLTVLCVTWLVSFLAHDSSTSPFPPSPTEGGGRHGGRRPAAMDRDSYTVVFAGLLLTAGSSSATGFGRLAAGHRSIAFFGFGSLLCAMGDSPTVFDPRRRFAHGLSAARSSCPSRCRSSTNVFIARSSDVRPSAIWAASPGQAPWVRSPAASSLNQFLVGFVFLVNVADRCARPRRWLLPHSGLARPSRPGSIDRRAAVDRWSRHVFVGLDSKRPRTGGRHPKSSSRSLVGLVVLAGSSAGNSPARARC